MNFRVVINVIIGVMILVSIPISVFSEDSQTLQNLRVAQDQEFFELRQNYNESVMKSLPARSDGTIDLTSEEYKKFVKDYSVERTKIRNKYKQLDIKRTDELTSILERYKQRIVNTGSAPANVNADVDLKSNDLEAAKNLSDHWSSQKNGHAIEYYTVHNPGHPQTTPPKNWEDVYKVVNPNTDTTLWTPETEAIRKAKIKDPDAWTTSGGQKGTGNVEMSRDTRGYYLDNEKKFVHADRVLSSKAGTHDENLKTFSKSVSKAGGPNGANIIKDNEKFYEQAKILQKYGDPVEAGIVNLGDSPEIRKSKIEGWMETARSEMQKARIKSQNLGDAADTARADLADQMRKQGDEDIAQRIEEHRQRVADTNRAAAEENNRLRKESEELNSKSRKSDSTIEDIDKTTIKNTDPTDTKISNTDKQSATKVDDQNHLVDKRSIDSSGTKQSKDIISVDASDTKIGKPEVNVNKNKKLHEYLIPTDEVLKKAHNSFVNADTGRDSSPTKYLKDTELADLANPKGTHKEIPVAKGFRDKIAQQKLKNMVKDANVYKKNKKGIEEKSIKDTVIGEEKINNSAENSEVNKKSSTNDDMVSKKLENSYDKLRNEYKDRVLREVPKGLDGKPDIESKEFNDIMNEYADKRRKLRSSDMDADIFVKTKKKSSIGNDIDIRNKKTPVNVDANIAAKGNHLRDVIDVIDVTEIAQVAFEGFQKATEAAGKAIEANRDLNSSDVINVVKDVIIYNIPGIAENKATEAALKKIRLDELSDSPEIRKLKEKRHALRNKKRNEGDPDWKTATLDAYDEYLLAGAEKKKQQALEKSLERQKQNMRIKELKSKLDLTHYLTFDEQMELASLKRGQVKYGAEDVKNMALGKFQFYVDKMQKKRNKEGRDKDEFIKDGIPMFLEMIRDGFNLINPASLIGNPVAEGFAEMTTWEKRQAWASSKDEWIKKMNSEAMKVDKNTRRNVKKLNQLLTSSDISDKNIQNQIEILLSQLRDDSEKLNQLNIFADKVLSGVDSKKLKRLRNLRISMPDVESLEQWKEQLIKEKGKQDDKTVLEDNTITEDHTTLEGQITLGGNVTLEDHATLGEQTTRKDNVILEGNTTLGGQTSLGNQNNSHNIGVLEIIYRIKGSGYTPHYGGGSYKNVGYHDVFVTLEEPATKKYIQKILDNVKTSHNIDICNVAISAYPSGNRPPAIWKTFKVRVIKGPASDLSNIKLENTWKSEGNDGPSLSELKKGCSK